MVATSFVVLAGASLASAEQFVPACIAEQCSAQAVAFGNDTYARSLGSCVATNFGPCAGHAWDCLGDPQCQEALQCGPKVFDTCKDSIWTMMTDPDERDKVECLLKCEKDGKFDPLCVAAKCSVAAVKCLTDSTCLEAATCIPKALLSCSGEAFGCIFGTDKVCQENLKCLGHGISECAAPTTNILTDARIADFISCAGSSCPHPSPPHHKDNETMADAEAAPATTFQGTPSNPTEQLLCMAAKCGAKTLKILADQDTKDLLSCALQDDMPDLCPSVWECLGDEPCSQAVSCWSKPFETCSNDIWRSLTNADQRSRIESVASCLHSCEASHSDDFVDATFCVLDSCGHLVLDCNQDDVCREAVKCVPKTLGQCVIPQLETYTQQELLRNSTKCIGRGLELCGAAAVEMLRNADLAEAVQCASQCTIPPALALV